MTLQAIIEEKLSRELDPVHLEVINESARHNVPPGSESHFKVVIASHCFDGDGAVTRHRTVNRVLAEELAGPVHALALHTLTPREWSDRAGRTSDSPECRGGGNAS